MSDRDIQTLRVIAAAVMGFITAAALYWVSDEFTGEGK